MPQDNWFVFLTTIASYIDIVSCIVQATAKLAMSRMRKTIGHMNAFLVQREVLHLTSGWKIVFRVNSFIQQNGMVHPV